MIGVIDASALIRLFIPDGPVPAGLEPFLRRVEQGVHTALAPELLSAETANVLWKKVRRDELERSEASELLRDMMAMPIRYIPHSTLIEPAFDIAAKCGLTVYDSLYLAVASEQNAMVFTADDKVMQSGRELGLLLNDSGTADHL